MTNNVQVITGKENIDAFRFRMLIRGCRMEASGMRLTRGPSCLSILKRECGFKGSRDKVLAQAEALLAKEDN